MGKSSLVNRLLGEERVIVTDVAGTTRDAIDTRIEFEGREVVLVDTAGLRRRTKVAGTVDYYAQLRSEQAAERADVAIVVCDASEGVTTEDLRVAELAMKQKCATVIALNKWDITQTDLEDAKARVARKLRQRPQVMAVAAASGRGLKRLVAEALWLADRSAQWIPTPELNRFLGDLQAIRQPAGGARQAAEDLLHDPVRDEPAALRDPGEQPRPRDARLRVLPREPAARALRARGRAARDRLQDVKGREASGEVPQRRRLLDDPEAAQLGRRAPRRTRTPRSRSPRATACRCGAGSPAAPGPSAAGCSEPSGWRPNITVPISQPRMPPSR